MTGFRLEEFNSTPVGVAITNQPQSVVVGELQSATFSVKARGNPKPTYQWYKNNSPISDATNSSYTIAAAPLSDNGATFKVIASNVTNGVVNTSTSSDALLTVTADHTAPTISSAISVSKNSVLVTFSETVTELTATNLNNYSIVANAGGASVPISAASIQANASNVVLTTTTLAGNAAFTLTVSNIRDRSVAANQIADNSTITFNTVAGFTQVDIGTATLAASVTNAGNGFDVSGSGADIGGTSDQFTFGYQQRSAISMSVRGSRASPSPTSGQKPA